MPFLLNLFILSLTGLGIVVSDSVLGVSGSKGVGVSVPVEVGEALALSAFSLQIMHTAVAWLCSQKPETELRVSDEDPPTNERGLRTTTGDALIGCGDVSSFVILFCGDDCGVVRIIGCVRDERLV